MLTNKFFRGLLSPKLGDGSDGIPYKSSSFEGILVRLRCSFEK